MKKILINYFILVCIITGITESLVKFNNTKYIVQYIDDAQLETEIVNSAQLDSLINILESSKTKYWVEDY